MKCKRKNIKYSRLEVDRRTIRYTFRTQSVIYDYLYKTAEKQGIPINDLLNSIVWQHIKKNIKKGDIND